MAILLVLGRGEAVYDGSGVSKLYK